MKTISDDQIRERAYLLAESHGFPHGMDFEFWLEAEKELIEEAIAADKVAKEVAPIKKTVKKKAVVKKKAPAPKAASKKKAAKKAD